MYTIDNKITDLKVKERSIFRILYSMNSHPVATPEMSVEEARCYILFFSEGPNLTSYIGLYLPRNDRKFFYAYTSNPFPFEAADEVENEARQFAEDMGFLLDEINVSGMAVEDRNHWIEDQYIFGYKKPELPEEEEEEPEEDVEEEVDDEIEEEEEPEEEEKPAAKPSGGKKAAKEEITEKIEEKPEPVAAAAPPVQKKTPPPAPPPVQPAQQTGQPYPGYPQQMPPQYPPMQTPQDLEVPELDVPDESVPDRAAQPVVPAAKKKAPPVRTPPAAARRQVREEPEVEEELPVEVEEEPARSRGREVPRMPVARQPQPKAAQASVTGTTGTVTRDKEALARLLSSF